MRNCLNGRLVDLLNHFIDRSVMQEDFVSYLKTLFGQHRDRIRKVCSINRLTCLTKNSLSASDSLLYPFTELPKVPSTRLVTLTTKNSYIFYLLM